MRRIDPGGEADYFDNFQGFLIHLNIVEISCFCFITGFSKKSLYSPNLGVAFLNLDFLDNFQAFLYIWPE